MAPHPKIVPFMDALMLNIAHIQKAWPYDPIERLVILIVVRKRLETPNKGPTVKQIAQALSMEYENVRRKVALMVEAGYLARDKGGLCATDMDFFIDTLEVLLKRMEDVLVPSDNHQGPR